MQRTGSARGTMFLWSAPGTGEELRVANMPMLSWNSAWNTSGAALDSVTCVVHDGRLVIVRGGTGVDCSHNATRGWEWSGQATATRWLRPSLPIGCRTWRCLWWWWFNYSKRTLASIVNLLLALDFPACLAPLNVQPIRMYADKCPKTNIAASLLQQPQISCVVVSQSEWRLRAKTTFR